MKLKNIFRKPKLTKEKIDKINSTIKEIKECPYCAYLKSEIKMCLEKHKVKNTLKAITWHNIKCPDCRGRIIMITECKKRGHE